MNWPLAQTLGFLEPHLPSALVPPEQWPSLRALAGLLPEAISSLYLECRLGGALAPVDLLACVDTAHATESELAQAASGWEAVLARGTAPGWTHLSRFFTDWSRPGTLLQRHVPLLWLECDAPSEAPPVAPSLLICLDPVPLGRPGPAGPPGPSHLLGLIEAALEASGEAPLAGGVRAALVSCLEHLPPGGRAGHLSLMSARRPPVLKLNVSLPRPALGDYLRAVAWPGDPAGPGAMLEVFAPGVKTVQLDLTLADGTLVPRVGLEFFDLGTRGVDPGRRALIDTCVCEGLCTPEQRDALRAWPGSVRERYRKDGWPSRVDRWVDVKLVHQPGPFLSAKAYLGAGPRFSLL